MTFSKHKFYVALGGLLAVIAGVLADGALSSEDILAIASAAVAAGGVYFVPNKPTA